MPQADKKTTTMKKTTYILLSSVLALVLGLVLGYWFFSPAEEAGSHEGHGHSSQAEVWTCSMHPQIRQPEPGACPICGMDLIPADNAGGEEAPGTFTMTASAVALAQIQTTTVGTAAAERGATSLSGQVVIDQNREYRQVLHVGGRIEQMLVREVGQEVAAGQRIATLYSPALVTAQEELLSIAGREPVDSVLLRAAKEKLRRWKVSERQLAALLQSGKVQTQWPLYADFGGVVTALSAEPGQYLPAGGLLYRLANLKSVWAELEAYQQDLAAIDKGQEVLVTVPAYSRAKEFSTQVSFIDPQMDPRTGLSKVRVELPNASGLLKPGMQVTARLFAPGDKDAQLLIPATAVMWTGRRSIVYRQVSIEPPAFELVEVMLDDALGEYYPVVSGLNAGDAIVTEGTFTVDAAAQLNGKYSMMNPARSKAEGFSRSIPDYSAEAGDGFMAALQDLLSGYIALKDDLVESDSAKAAQKATSLAATLPAAIQPAMSREAGRWWKEQREMMHKAIAGMSDASAGLKAQRSAFQDLSDALIATVRGFGAPMPSLYVQHCPMYNNYQGGDWLSRDDSILNPYFGDKMLHCGEVTETLSE